MQGLFAQSTALHLATITEKNIFKCNIKEHKGQDTDKAKLCTTSVIALFEEMNVPMTSQDE